MTHRSTLLPLAASLALAACGDDSPPGEVTFAEPTFSAAITEDDRGAFMNTWGPSPDEIYVVGGQPGFGESTPSGVVLRYDGSTFTEMSVPAGGMLNWVHGAGGVAWVVGEEGRALRIDGDEVTEFDTGTDATLWGVWCARADACWAVGGDPRDVDSAPVAIAWDGTDWTEVSLPPTERSARALFKVWGTGPDNVVAVGAAGLIYHFDGSDWIEVESGVRDDLVSLWGTGPDEIVAVGGRSSGVAARWDGTAWTGETFARVPGLNGVWMNSEGTAWAVGVNGVILRLAAGSGFEFEELESSTRNVLHGVFGFDEGPFVAVGGTLNRNPPYVGDVLVSAVE